jgi:hypothetical protein
MRAYEFINPRIEHDHQLNESFNDVLVAAKKAPWFKFLSAALGGSLLVDFYDQYSSLSSQYSKYQNGDQTTTLFKNMTPEQANKVAYEEKSRIIGTITTELLLIFKVPSKAFKLIQVLLTAGGYLAGGALGAIVGGVPGAIAGSRVGASLGKSGGFLISKLIGFIEKGSTSPFFLAFLKSDYGQDFLNSWVVKLITTNAGELGVDLYDKGIKAIKSTGVEVPKAMTSDIKKPDEVDSQTDTSRETSKWDSPPLVVQFDKKNKNIIYVNNVQVTDAEGYQITGDSHVRDIKQKAALIKADDPTRLFKRRPGKNYNF